MCPHCGGIISAAPYDPGYYLCAGCNALYSAAQFDDILEAQAQDEADDLNGEAEEDDDYVTVDVPQDVPPSPPQRGTRPTWITENEIRSMYATLSNVTSTPPPMPEEVPPRNNNDHPPERGGTVLPRELPAGFLWYGDPPTRGTAQGTIIINDRYVVWDGPAQGSRATYADRIAALREWATTHSVRVVGNRQRETTITENEDGTGWTAFGSQTFRWAVFTQARFEYNYGPGAVDWFSSPGTECHCGVVHEVGAIRCPTDGLPLYCSNCGDRGAHVHWSEQAGEWFCDNCGNICDDCNDTIIAQSTRYCEDCRTIVRCTSCRRLSYYDVGTASTGHNADGVCPECQERLCPQCNTISRHPLAWSTTEERYLCRGCHRESLGDTTEDSDDDDSDTQHIDPIPGRENIRLCGIELEGGNGSGNGSTLAQELYRAGLAQHNSMQGYHHGGGSFIHVEADSSVDWEIVIGPLNPADRSQMKAVNSCMRLVRQGIKAGRYKLDLRCGLHIHVGAAKFGLAQAYNLNTLFSYIEDLMFRLAAAKWPLHRSMTGSPYCQPVKKPGSKVAFGRELSHDSRNRDSRRVALNFANYFTQMLSRCQCGAVQFDSWEQCTCDLGKCTFEFRLFNSTANPRKLHAYLALAQALVAKAGDLPEIQNPEVEYPAQSFLPKPFKGMTDQEQIDVSAGWLPRLRWVFTELPLTDEEKESIMYCVQNSELVMLGQSALDDLTRQEVSA